MILPFLLALAALCIALVGVRCVRFRQREVCLPEVVEETTTVKALDLSHLSPSEEAAFERLVGMGVPAHVALSFVTARGGAQ